MDTHVPGKYVRVGKKKGPLVLGGAMKKFEEDPDFVYVPMFHVAGPKEEVEQWLQENQPDELKKALDSCYSSSNMRKKSVKENFEKELKNSAMERRAVNNARNEMRQIDLTVLTTILRAYDESRKNMEVDMEDKKPKTLKTKILQLAKEGKVLDVTKMLENGNGTSKTTYSAKSKKKRLSQKKSDILYNVVYNSEHPDVKKGVEHFLTLYGGFTDKNVSDILEAVGTDTIINISPTRSPMRSPTKKSRRVRSPARFADVEDDD